MTFILDVEKVDKEKKSGRGMAVRGLDLGTDDPDKAIKKAQELIAQARADGGKAEIVTIRIKLAENGAGLIDLS